MNQYSIRQLQQVYCFVRNTFFVDVLLVELLNHSYVKYAYKAVKSPDTIGNGLSHWNGIHDHAFKSVKSI